MSTINLTEVKKISLSKRDVRVLIGNGSPVTSESMTFGVATVPPVTKMDQHTHGNEEEIIYILSGNGYVEMNGIKENIKDGTAVKIPTGSSHSICNESPENMNFIFCFNPPVKIGSYDKK